MVGIQKVSLMSLFFFLFFYQSILIFLLINENGNLKSDSHVSSH